MLIKLTDLGKDVLLRGLSGDTIKFTEVKLGNGEAQSNESAKSLKNPLTSASITKVAIEDGYANLSVKFSNEDIENGFRITEMGVYAKVDEEGPAVLYAIGNEDESKAEYIPGVSERIYEMQLDILIFVGDSENITANINSSVAYVSKTVFEKHTANLNNPHNVSASQVGLGNVPNVATDDQTPTFTEAKKTVNIESGERVSVLFGKIKRAISALISHLENRDNPHKISAKTIGAAESAHSHNSSDINAGVLPVVRGGTGVDSLSALSTVILGDAVVTGTYIGDGASEKTIYLGFNAKAVWVTSSSKIDELFSAFALKGHPANGTGEGYTEARGSTRLEITNNGFKVRYRKGTSNGDTSYTNYKDSMFYYIALK